MTKDCSGFKVSHKWIHDGEYEGMLVDFWREEGRKYPHWENEKLILRFEIIDPETGEAVVLATACNIPHNETFSPNHKYFQICQLAAGQGRINLDPNALRGHKFKLRVETKKRKKTAARYQWVTVVLDCLDPLRP